MHLVPCSFSLSVDFWLPVFYLVTLGFVVCVGCLPFYCLLLDLPFAGFQKLHCMWLLLLLFAFVYYLSLTECVLTFRLGYVL